MERAAEIKARFSRHQSSRGLIDTVSRMALSIFINMIARRIRKKHALKKAQKKAEKKTVGLKRKDKKVQQEPERKGGPKKHQLTEFGHKNKDRAKPAEKKSKKFLVLLLSATALLLVLVSRMSKKK
ncbi:MAG: hypothetical protein JW738_08960 [Actinobacteria bacterium]|nr:hypothetical protein [Actinomycetota bacterium]